MACNNTLSAHDIEIVKKAVAPLGLTAIEKVPEDLWQAYKALSSRQRDGRAKVAISARGEPGQPAEEKGAVEPFVQELDKDVSWLGCEKTTMDYAGHVTWVGNERVYRNLSGVATHIGERRIYRWSDGTAKFVGYDRAQLDIYGNVRRVGSETITPAAWKK